MGAGIWADVRGERTHAVEKSSWGDLRRNGWAMFGEDI